MLEPIIQVVEAVIWPITVLSIVLLLRDDIESLLQRATSAQFPGGAQVSFGGSAIDRLRGRETSTDDFSAQRVQANWDRVGNIYWLAHDLMWTIDTLLRDAPRTTIQHGLELALHHLRELDVSDKTRINRLQRLLAEVDNAMESELTSEKREDIARDLRSLTDDLGLMAEIEQGDFKAEPNEMGNT